MIILVVLAGLVCSVFVVACLLLSRWISAKTKTLAFWTSLNSPKILSLALIVGVSLALVLFILMSQLAKKDISSIVQAFKKCDRLEIHNSFYDYDESLGHTIYDIEDVTIQDRAVINKVADIIADSKFQSLALWAAMATKDLMIVRICNGSTELQQFEMIGPNTFFKKRFSYTYGKNGTLYSIRDMIGVRGGTKRFEMYTEILKRLDQKQNVNGKEKSRF